MTSNQNVQLTENRDLEWRGYCHFSGDGSSNQKNKNAGLHLGDKTLSVSFTEKVVFDDVSTCLSGLYIFDTAGISDHA